MTINDTVDTLLAEIFAPEPGALANWSSPSVVTGAGMDSDARSRALRTASYIARIAAEYLVTNFTHRHLFVHKELDRPDLMIIKARRIEDIGRDIVGRHIAGIA